MRKSQKCGKCHSDKLVHLEKCLHCICAVPDCERWAVHHAWCLYHVYKTKRIPCKDRNCWQCKKQASSLCMHHFGYAMERGTSNVQGTN
jgi:hypothetical protein